MADVANLLLAAQNRHMYGSQRRTAIVVGGGVSGLSTGWYLKKLRGEGVDVVVVDGAERAGGWVYTTSHGGHVLEAGPRGVRPQNAGKETLWVAEQLGLADQVIAADPSAKFRYLYSGGKLQRLPGSLLEAYYSPLTNWLYPVLKQEMIKRPAKNVADESIADFVTRRFNKRVLDTLVDPLVNGIFAGDPTKLSVRCCFAALPALEDKHGSVVRGLLAGALPSVFGAKDQPTLDPVEIYRGTPWLLPDHPESALAAKHKSAALVSFKGGMSTLTDGMAESLRTSCGPGAVRVGAGSAAVGLEFGPSGAPRGERVTVKLADGTSVQGDHVFLALPAKQSAALLAPHSDQLAGKLDAIEYSDVVLVTLAWDADVLPGGLVGFGHLIPKVEQQDVLGITWDSCTFPQQAGVAAGSRPPTRLTVFIGGTRQPKLAGWKAKGEDELRAVATRAVAEHLGVTDLPTVSEVNQGTDAIAQYTVGHKARVLEIERLAAGVSPRLTLTGSAFYGVAVNDIIGNARRTVLKTVFR